MIFFKWRAKFVLCIQCARWRAGRRKMNAIEGANVYVKIFAGIVVIKYAVEQIISVDLSFVNECGPNQVSSKRYSPCFLSNISWQIRLHSSNMGFLI